MVIIQENKLTEGVDLQAIQKDISAKIASHAIKWASYRAQKSSPQKIYVGVALGALQGVAEWMNPLGRHCPVGGNPQIQKDADVVYKKVLQNISDLQKVYEKSYNDDLW